MRAVPERDKPSQALSSLIQGCRNVLEELDAMLPKSFDNNSQNLRARSQSMWNRVKWDQKKIEGFRNRITSNTSLLNTFHHQSHEVSILAEGLTAGMCLISFLRSEMIFSN